MPQSHADLSGLIVFDALRTCSILEGNIYFFVPNTIIHVYPLEITNVCFDLIMSWNVFGVI